MRRKYLIPLWTCLFILLPTAMGQEPNVVEEAVKQGKSLWANAQLYLVSILIVFLVASIGYLIKLFKKDTLLKKLLDKYVVFEMKDGQRYRGTMRLEFTGLEIISEESRQRGHAPSYIFSNAERDQGIVAYIRYHDAMNERELRERGWELERVYHPPLIYRIGRKIRNTLLALRGAVEDAISMAWTSIRQSVTPRMGRYNQMLKQQDVEGIDKRLDALGDESTSYLEQESYERLIERLIGTRVKVRTHAGEYTAILKDYNEKHIALIDVKDKDNNGYKDEWGYTREHGHKVEGVNFRDDRGLRCRMEGNDEAGYEVIFENNAPYPIQLGRVILQDDAPKWEKNYEFKYHIQAFSVQRLRLPREATRRLEPFEKVAVRVPLNPNHYKKIGFQFRSFRNADIVFPRNSCTIVESAEKYQPELFSLTGLTDAILARRDAEDIAITDKEGKPVHGMNVVHGYVTNVNEERIDIKTIDTSYGRRWDVESAFGRFDAALRRGFPLLHRLFRASKVVTFASLVEQTHRQPAQHKILSPLIYPKGLSLPEKRARYLAKARLFLQQPNVMLRRTPSQVHTPLPMKVMALTGNGASAEFPMLERFEYVREHHLLYNAVQDLRTDRLAKTDILWIGNGEIYKAGYRLTIDAEHRIKNFVSQGGVVIVSGQDVKANYKQRRGTGWIPEPLTGVECEETYELIPTARGKRTGIFHSPNAVNGTHADGEFAPIRLDDMWLDPLSKWTSLAKSDVNDASALLLLPFQQGLYIVTSLKNETEEDVAANAKLMENLLHFSVKWLDKRQR